MGVAAVRPVAVVGEGTGDEAAADDEQLKSSLYSGTDAAFEYILSVVASEEGPADVSASWSSSSSFAGRSGVEVSFFSREELGLDAAEMARCRSSFFSSASSF